MPLPMNDKKYYEKTRIDHSIDKFSTIEKPTAGDMNSVKMAAQLRAVMAWYQMRIDDPVNGCWLPRNTEASVCMPRILKSAVAHSRIHRHNYYRWLDESINMAIIKNDKMLVQALKFTELKLQTSTFPKKVMLPAGKEL